MEEQVIIVNEANEPVEVVARSVMRHGALLHRSSYVIIINSQDEIIIQKRSPLKDIYPSYYDPTTGGVVQAGESYEENVLRELYEEVGIRGVQPSELFDFHFENEHFKVWGRVYWLRYDGPLVAVDGEVESFAFVPLHDALQVLKPENTMPDGLLVLKRFINEKPWQ